MNDREQFGKTIDVLSNDGALMLRGFDAGAESKQAELDKANARIAQLEEFILSITKCSGGMINGNRASMAAENVLALSSDTWLLENDKAVELRVFKDIIKIESNCGWKGVLDLIKSRK